MSENWIFQYLPVEAVLEKIIGPEAVVLDSKFFSSLHQYDAERRRRPLHTLSGLSTYCNAINCPVPVLSAFIPRIRIFRTEELSFHLAAGCKVRIIVIEANVLFSWALANY